MKLLFFLVCLSAATSSVIAPGGASTSETDAVSESNLTVTSAAGHSFRIKPDTLRKDMNHEKDLRRFLYLGPTRHRRKDMLLAFPLRLRAPRTSQPKELAESIYKGGYSPDYLEPGHVLTIEEVFSELRTIDYRRI
ncbi:uncharacterized protein UDID_18795 [Ustilago sp. UG-2017a]|nr:uncharacterized protein UDID_18795 [Ustilago sp. UG-2017a]